MRAFGAAFRVGFLHLLKFRAELLIQLFASAVIIGLNGAIWGTALAGRAEVAGLPADRVHAFVIVGWASVSFFATRVHEDIALRFREGQVQSDLLHPQEMQLFWYARDLGRALCGFCVQTVPLFIGCYLYYGIPLPEQKIIWPVTLLSLLLGHLVSFDMSFLIGLSAQYLRSITGLSHIKGTLVSLFSGALVPLELFSPFWRPLIYALPFRAMAHSPCRIFLEAEAHWAAVLGFQALWGLGLWGMGALAWRWVQQDIRR